MRENILIRLGKNSDIDEILALQKFWLKQAPGNKEGFLFGCPYNKPELEKIIFNQSLVIAEVENNFAGFFLIDNVSGNQLTNQYKKLVNEYHQHFGGITCPRAQIAIKPEYLGLGISNLLTLKLISHLKNSYDSVFSLVSKKNKNITKHLKNGWKVIHEDPEMYYVKLNFKAEKKGESLI